MEIFAALRDVSLTSNTLWLVLSLCVGAVTLAVVVLLRSRLDTSEMGAVSIQWLTEKRSHDREFRLR